MRLLSRFARALSLGTLDFRQRLHRDLVIFTLARVVTILVLTLLPGSQISQNIAVVQIGRNTVNATRSLDPVGWIRGQVQGLER